MLLFLVYTDSQPRRFAAPLLTPTSIPASMRRNSHGIKILSNPHPLTPIESHFYKKPRGGTASLACFVPRGEGVCGYRTSSKCTCFDLSRLFSDVCALFSATALLQLFCLQCLAHSFYRDGGVGGCTSISRHSDVWTLRPSRVPAGLPLQW